MSEELVKANVTVSPGGVAAGLEIGREIPAFLARLFPTWAAKSNLRAAISTSIVEKVRAGNALEDADVKFIELIAGDAEAKWARRQAVARRALRALEGRVAPVQSAPSAEGRDPAPDTTTATTDDWISKFWEDAGLVSDEMLQELYARVLSTESVGPGACSLRTLRVLRYLDRPTAEAFSRLVPLVFSLDWIPRDVSILEPAGITYGMLLDLDDAGLVDSNPQLEKQFNTDGPSFIRHGNLILMIENCSGLKFETYLLTKAGRELARVADIIRPRETFFSVAKWIIRPEPGWMKTLREGPGPSNSLPPARNAKLKISWAEAPDPQWSGTRDQLVWNELPLS